MGDNNTHSELELDGLESASAVNDSLPIPDGEQDAAREHMRKQVERMRATQEIRQEATPDPEFVEHERELRELMTERLADELEIAEKYAELHERREAAVADVAESFDGDE